MNDTFAHEQAGKFGERLLRERDDDPARLELAFQAPLAGWHMTGSDVTIR